jgi:serpin B
MASGAFAKAPPPAEIVTLANANNTFACDLYARLKDTAAGNLFFSPFSISSALAMTSAGAQGDTAAQMWKTLRFPLAQDKLHPAFAALLRHMDDAQSPGAVRLRVANSLWPQQGAALLDRYLALARQNYGGAVTLVDYLRREPEARAQINRWVEEKTEGKIQNIIANPLDPLTRLTLVNAVYFKGAWENPFEKHLTKDAPFFVMDDTGIQTPFMMRTDSFKYAKRNGVHVLELPYTGGGFSMLVILPDDKTPTRLVALENTLTAKRIATWRAKLKMQEVQVFLPKFKITWGAESLKKLLQQLGIKDAFSVESADFSGMSGAKDFSISDVLHKAFVEVHEAGAEAAAATVVELVALGISNRPPPPVFRADHPFLFLIQENATGSILFMGRMAVP